MARPALTLRGQVLRIALAIPALIGIFFLGQGLLDARSWRIDLTPERRYTLSEHARQVLGGLDRDVRVLAFLRSQDPRNPLIDDLLRQVRAVGRRMHVDVVDVNRSPALAREYGVDSYGALVVESEGRRRVFSNPREETLVAAVLQVTRQQRKTVAWVTGHGEGDPASNDRARGYTTARIFLEQEYYEVVPISLLGDEVPVGTAVLVIAGPQKDYMPEELAALDRYLQRPGNTLALLDPQHAPALANFLGQYRVALPDDVVVDPAARMYGGEYLTMQVGYDRGSHPIVGPLEAPPLFSLSRSVDRIAEEIPGTWFTSLLQSSPESWATTDLSVVRTGAGVFVTGRDRRGPVTLGAEVEFTVPAPAGGEARTGRLVVYGNAEFANNFFIEYLGNKDLFVNTVAWLARDPDVIGHRRSLQEPGRNQFFMTSEQGDHIFWAAAVVQPLLFALVGHGPRHVASLEPVTGMGWRQVGLLYLVFAILTVLYVRERPPEPQREGGRPPRPRFLQISAADVSAIRLVRGGRAVSLRREGPDWVVVEPTGMRLPNDLVAGFLQALLTTEEIDHIATTTGELGSFGLDEQADRVELGRGEGEAVVVTLGGTNPTGTALYARRGPDGGVVLIGRQVRDYEDMIYDALPRGAVPADTADGRIGARTPLLFNGAAV